MDFLIFSQIQGMFLYHVLNLVKSRGKMVENSDFDHYFHEFSRFVLNFFSKMFLTRGKNDLFFS